MTQTDLMSWRMEDDPVLRSTIVSIMFLDKSPDQNRLVDVLRRAIEVLPMFKCRAVGSSFCWIPPRWIDDRDFDLSWHVRRCVVPEPRTRKVVLDFARTTGMSAFDKDRPLWEFTVLDGLADGGAALVVKVHHSLTDGVSGMQLTREIMDTTREGESARSALVPEISTDSDSSESVGYRVWAAVAAAAVPAVRAAASTVEVGVRAVRHPGSSGRAGVGIAASALRMVRPATTTLSPVMTDRSTRRCIGTLEVSVAALTAAAAVTQCSINDAFLAAVLLGMAQYHRRHGATTPELRVTMPISLRTSQDPLGGNRITLARFALPVDIADPDQLMHRVHAIVDRWRREPAVPLSPGVAGALNLLPVAVLGNIFKHMDFVASDVIGPSQPLYIAGAEITRQFAFSPTLGSAFNVTLMSYSTHMCVGINADAAAIADLPVLMKALADGFRAVVELCPKHVDTTVTVEC